jgi:uncharacterized RDD family membrane protein YckC
MVAQNGYGPAPGEPDDPEASMTTTQQPDPFGAGAGATTGPSGPRAGFWFRFAAWFVDGLVLVVPSIVLVIAFGPSGARPLYLLLSAAYFTLMEGGPTGQTLGKRLLRIRVIDLRVGGPIGPGRGFVRWIGRFVSGLAFFLGYFWMLWDPEKQTWHDKMANAVVVPTSAYPVG